MSYKSFVLKATPDFLHIFIRDVYFILRMVPNYLYDFRRFLVFSGMNKSRKTRAERAARIVLFYHQVEKGLSLAQPRPGFGMTVIPRLLDDVEAYVAAYGVEAPATTAMAALRSYVEFNERHGVAADKVKQRLEAIQRKFGISSEVASRWTGGTREVDREAISTARAGSFTAFFESRHSVRQFVGGSIPESDIHNAVALSQKSPSVCNRQCWKVHAFSNPAEVKHLLEIQSGSRGFSENVSTVLVITAELGNFLDVAERYQAWIDGGMFAMSLCLALHEQGYGTCCLNWSKERHTDRHMHSAAAIPESEQIIMLLAVGHIPERFEVARSYRPPVEECLRIH